MKIISFLFLFFWGNCSISAFQFSPTELMLKGLQANKLTSNGLKNLIKKGANVNSSCSDTGFFNHFKPVHLAAFYANEPLLRMLSEQGANLNEPLKYPKSKNNNSELPFSNYTAAFFVAQNSKATNCQLLDFLVNYNYNHKQNTIKNGQNLLFAALNTTKPNLYTVKHLLKKNVNVQAIATANKQNYNLFTYFATTHANFNDSLANLLRDKGLKQLYSFDTLTYLQFCIKNDKFRLIKYVVANQLIDLSADSSAVYGNGLNMAIYHSKFSIFFYLFQQNMNTNSSGVLGTNGLDFAKKKSEQIYFRLLANNNLSDKEFYFLYLCNTTLYDKVQILYTPFVDSVFYNSDTTTYDMKKLQGNKRIFIINKSIDTYYSSVLTKLKYTLSNVNYSNYHLLALNTDTLNAQYSNLNNYYKNERLAYAHLPNKADSYYAKNIEKFIFLVDEYNQTIVKIPFEYFLTPTTDFTMLFNAFLSM